MLEDDIAPNTYVPPTPLDNLDVFVGDPKQKSFHPRVKIQKWNNEVNLSVGIKHSGGRHKVVGDKIHYTGGDIGANFYPVSATVVPSKKIRYISQGSLAPEYIAAQYELDRHVPQQDMLINSHFPKEGMMYYGYYRKAAYIKNKRVDVPEIRLAISGRENDPMYMDHGLPLIDVHYKDSDNHALIDSATKQAVKDILGPYGLDISFDGGKGYFRHNRRQVKFFSAAFIGGHYYYYINLETDYNRAYDYFDGKPTIRNPYAYGVRSVNPNIPDGVVDKVVARFAQLYGLPLYDDSFSAREQKVIESLVPIHTDQAWIENADRGPFSSHATPQDGYEFEIILHRKPSTNVVPLSVKTKNLTFHYQPQLSDEEATKKHRPPEVVGSYAAYHVDKMHNEYQAGKAFHIYRPWAIDAAGNKVWCDFDPNWDGVGDLEISIPIDFLQTASYPIIIDPTFGYTTMGASNVNPGNAPQGLKNVTGVAGTINYLVANLVSPGGASGKAAIYNTLGTKVAGSNEIVNIPISADNSSGDWFAFSITGTTVSTSGYDLIFWGTNTSYFSFMFDSATNAGVVTIQSYVSGNDGFAASDSGFQVDNDKYSIYATSDVTIGNESDTVATPTENVKMTLVDNAKGTDSTSTSENVKMNLTMSIAVSDSTSLTENIQMNPQGASIISDSTSLSENVQLMVDENIKVSDSTSISESYSLNLPDYTYFVSTSDTVASSEAISLLETSFAAVSDTVSTAENILLQIDESISVSDTVATSESINGNLTSYIAVSESTSTSESIHVELNSFGVASDTVTTNESVNLQLTSFISSSDSTSLSESIGVLLLSQISVSDTVSTAESVGVNMQITINTSDTVATSESISILAISNINVSDSVATSESISVVVSDPQITVSDTVTTSESIAVSESIQASVSDTVSTAENVSAVISSFIATSDSIATSESITLLLTSFIAVSDSVTTSDVATIADLEGLVVSDSVSTSESLGVVLSDPQISVNDTVSTSETISVNEIIQAAVSDSVATSENVSAVISSFVSTSDNVSTNENVHILETSFILVSDNAATSDVATIADLEGLVVSDSVSTSESISVTVSDPQIVVNDTITTSESASVALSSPTINVSDSVTTSELVSAFILTLFINVNETVFTADFIFFQTPLLAQDTTTVTESVAVATGPMQVATSDTVTTAELLKMTVVNFIAASDTTVVTENVIIIVRSSTRSTSFFLFFD